MIVITAIIKKIKQQLPKKYKLSIKNGVKINEIVINELKTAVVSGNNVNCKSLKQSQLRNMQTKIMIDMTIRTNDGIIKQIAIL